MWSGIDRYDYYSYSSDNVQYWGFSNYIPNIKNPTNIIEDKYNWRIINHNWKNLESIKYYEIYHTDIFSMITTIEHILRVQYYLKNLNISYFMTSYLDIFDKKLVKNDEINYLYKLKHFLKFLPVNGCYEWVKDNYPVNGFNSPDKNGYIGIHPTSFGHKMFSDDIIFPFLINNNLI